MGTTDTFARNLRILRRYTSGERQADLAREYGVSRERVRQICMSFGAEKAHQQQRRARKALADKIASEDLTLKEAARRLKVSVTHVYMACKENGVQPRRDYAHSEDEIKQAATLVASGQSIRKVCGGDNYLSGLVAQYCRDHGIALQHGRWRDLSKRAALVTSMREQRASWSDVAKAVSEMEDRFISVGTITVWARGNVPDIFGKGIRARQPTRRKQSAPKAKPRVIVASNPRDAARLNYGKAPASIVAALHGVSRNSIIGHWYRMRQTGEIA